MIHFVKEAGARVFGIGETKGDKAKREQEKAEALVTQIKTLGIADEDLRIDVKDDVATVSGRAVAQILRLEGAVDLLTRASSSRTRSAVQD